MHPTQWSASHDPLCTQITSVCSLLIWFLKCHCLPFKSPFLNVSGFSACHPFPTTVPCHLSCTTMSRCLHCFNTLYVLLPSLTCTAPLPSLLMLLWSLPPHLPEHPKGSGQQLAGLYSSIAWPSFSDTYDIISALSKDRFRVQKSVRNVDETTNCTMNNMWVKEWRKEWCFSHRYLILCNIFMVFSLNSCRILLLWVLVSA
jgi:hypothetical protein